MLITKKPLILQSTYGKKKLICCIVSYQIYIKKSNLYLLYQIYSEYETSDKTSIYYKHK